MTEVVARVLAKAIRDTLVSQAAGLPESRPLVAEAIRSFALGLNRLGLNAGALLQLSILVRSGAPADAPAIAAAVQSSLQLEEIPKTKEGMAAMADLVDILAAALMPLKIDVSPLGDVADLLRKGGL